MRRTYGHASRYAADRPSPFSASARSAVENLNPEVRNAPEVLLIVCADKDAIPKVKCGSCDSQVVRRDQLSPTTQMSEQISPALGDLLPELDERDTTHERGDLCAASRSSTRAASQRGADEQLRVHDRGKDD